MDKHVVFIVTCYGCNSTPSDMWIPRSKNFTKYEDAYAAGFEDMVRRVPDISKLTNFTGWEPKLGLTAIIEDVSKSYT